MTDWVQFHDHIDESETHIHGLSRILLHRKTAYQTILIAESSYFGKLLIIDGDVQSSLADEYRYHEALVQPAMLLIPDPKRIYLAGGGEGATLREILKHPSVETVLKCDIDGEAIELYKEYLPEWHQGSFDDPRVRLFHQDARSHLQIQENHAFDIIFTDLTEPFEDGPSKALFSKEFFTLCAQKLRPDGCLALQASQLTNRHHAMHRAIRKTLQQCFPIVRSYAVYIESFDTMWAFLIASNQADPCKISPEQIDDVIQTRKLSDTLRFYDGFTHQHLFSNEKDIRSWLDESSHPVIEDQRALVLNRKDRS